MDEKHNDLNKRVSISILIIVHQLRSPPNPNLPNLTLTQSAYLIHNDEKGNETIVFNVGMILIFKSKRKKLTRVTLKEFKK